MKDNVAGVVVLYNPGFEVLNNINTYRNQVDKLFIIDNSEIINATLIDQLQKLTGTEYTSNHSNLGIAAALNIAARLAINLNYKYLLTMDDDSLADDNLVIRLLANLKGQDDIAIVSPYQLDDRHPDYPVKSEIVEVDFVWTSGNLINLEAFAKTDGFREDYFIDYVDHEFCLRLKKMGYKIIRDDSILLQHNCGNTTRHRFFNDDSVFTTNHSPLRLYYRTRNRFVTQIIYKSFFPDYVKVDRIRLIKELLKIILYEKLKLRKLYMMAKGYWHYKRNRLGKY